MSDLTDERLSDIERDVWHREPNRAEVQRMVAEIRRHRSAMARLEAWASELDGRGPYNEPIAAEIRNRIKGNT